MPPRGPARARAARRNPGAPGAPSQSSAAAAGSIRLQQAARRARARARRKCDALIAAGSVRVNGTVVKEPGTAGDPERDRIEVHGRPIPGRATLRYLMVHKPTGVITTLDDPEGRPTIRTLLPPGPRLFPVGRLDADSSGLILVTNDGELRTTSCTRATAYARSTARGSIGCPMPSRSAGCARGSSSSPAW